MSESSAQVGGIEVSTDHWIGGKRVPGTSRFATVSPIDGSHLADVAAGGQAEIDMAVEAAAKVLSSAEN